MSTTNQIESNRAIAPPIRFDAFARAFAFALAFALAFAPRMRAAIARSRPSPRARLARRRDASRVATPTARMKRRHSRDTTPRHVTTALFVHTPRTFLSRERSKQGRRREAPRPHERDARDVA